MSLNSVTRKALLSASNCSKSLPVYHNYCCGSSLSRPANVLSRNFHHQFIIQRHTGPYGILFEALQKGRGSKSIGDAHHFNIPDELRRLKSGSLKWLFEVWPTDKKNYSALTTIRSALQQEVDNELEVKKMVARNQKMLRSASEQQLFDVLDYLKMRNIAIRRLVKIPWLLAGDPEAIEAGVIRVQKLLNIKEFKVAISFANVNENKLMEVAATWKWERVGELSQFNNRIEWLACRLSCSNEDVSDMMARFPNLMLVPVRNIQQVLTYLFECKIQPEAIISDPWVFSSNLKTIHSRGSILRENEIEPVKPWVFRCPQRHFDKLIQRRLAQRELLGEHKNIQGFLHEKLECPDGSNIASEMLIKVPSIKRATVIKLNEMIEFLFSVGFTAPQIRETPRILAHSVETISERLHEVSSFNKPVKNLQLLCRTSKDYRAILRKLKADAKAERAASKKLHTL